MPELQHWDGVSIEQAEEEKDKVINQPFLEALSKDLEVEQPELEIINEDNEHPIIYIVSSCLQKRNVLFLCHMQLLKMPSLTSSLVDYDDYDKRLFASQPGSESDDDDSSSEKESLSKFKIKKYLISIFKMEANVIEKKKKLIKK